METGVNEHDHQEAEDGGKRRIARSCLRPFKPNRGVLAITASGPSNVPVEEVSPERVGWKAFGLSALPPEWVPSFFVIESACVDSGIGDTRLQSWINQCLAEIRVQNSMIFVRSSGAAETMRNRGRLVSHVCQPEAIVATIKELSVLLQGQEVGGVHWVIQQYVRPTRRGHLSNERHLVYESRDWVAELELHEDQPGYTTRFGVRPWRDGTVIDGDLSCVSEPQITLRLRQVAMWATTLCSRLHFEWVWNGAAIRLVQADVAEAAGGVNPTLLRPREVPEILLESLRVFEAARPEDYEKYRKLHNAKVYREMGYSMPTFYVLRDPVTIKGVLQNDFSPSLLHDLAGLTKHPLIIRTDGEGIPQQKQEMLPRSDELRTSEEARNWLSSQFAKRIQKGGLESASICLIAHHFIPSIASAWARAEPGKRIVRIESLWGLPDGLYWYSHDTFEVDTQPGVPLKSGTEYVMWRRHRYKGTFIAPDESGRWVPFHTAEPYDWRASIGRKRWVYEIASTTRMLADHEKYPVSVMWFIDNDPRATKHKVLPWFHSRSELGGLPKAAPRRKLTIARDYKIKTERDWEELKQHVLGGRHVERVVVEPSNTELARDPQFAEELSKFAAGHNIVIELEGGILSHAYYILQRHGAQVECVDLFGADEDILEFNKLVRDKIPAVIESRGERVEVVQLSGDALLTALRRKLVEEALEALDANAGGELVGELADVQEVLNAIIKALALDRAQLEIERTEKRKRRGGFDQGIMLTRTTTPHSLSAPPPSVKESKLALNGKGPAMALILEPSAIPSPTPYRRPDLRNVGQHPEKLFAFEAELNRLVSAKGTAKESITFSIPIDNESSREFTLTLEFSRNRSALRGNVRLRLNPSQLAIPDSQMRLDFQDEGSHKEPAPDLPSGSKTGS